MIRRITAIVLTVCILLCFASCDGTKTEVHINNNIDNNIDNQIQQGDSDIDIQEPSTESEKPTQDIPKEEPTQNQEPKPTIPSHTHSYSVATCTQARTCSCGATSGVALGHAFSNATCTSAKVCSRCGTISGSALGHSYSAATCTTAKKCSRCGITSGSALGHNYVNNRCSRCGKTDPDSLPVGLERLHIVDNSGTMGYTYEYESGAVTDSYGNTYIGHHLFRTYVHTNYVTFNLNKQYSKLSFDIIAPDSMSSGYTNSIEIYVDGVLKYSKNDITKTTKKTSVNIDVGGGELLTIKTTRVKGVANYTSVLAIVNAQLTK